MKFQILRLFKSLCTMIIIACAILVIVKSGIVLDWTPYSLVTQVWHHGATIGILTLKHYQFIVNCRLILIEKKDESYKNAVLEDLSYKYSIQEVDFNTMLDVVKACEDLQPFPEVQAPGGVENKNLTKVKDDHLTIFALIKGIVPGTKWCGFNDIAKDYRDLGKDFRLDKCCRAHDHCPIKIKAFSENFGAMNYHPYTKSHCACDDIFYKCLKEIGDEKSLAVGNVFFNAMGLQCAQDIKRKKCNKYANKPKLPLQVAKRNHLIRKKRYSWSAISDFLGWHSDNSRQDQNKCLEWTEFISYIFKYPKKKF